MLKVQSVKAENFASYKDLAFDFRNQGLTLIQGPTGSGKSTLCDLIPWVLFGKTAKGGAVSEVLTWPGSAVTSVTLWADNVTISRSRGPNAKDNDLTFWPVNGVVTRGKDLNDTQRLINTIIGMDYDLYLASSYYHEFSQTAQFFTTTAKSRRVICEQLVDLTLAKTLQFKTSEELKALNKEKSSIENYIQAVKGKVSLLQRLQASEHTKAETWEETRMVNIELAGRQYEAFELNRKKTISKKCSQCNTVLQQPKEVIDTSENPYTSRLLDLEAQVNPYTGTVKDYSTEIASQELEEQTLNTKLSYINTAILDAELLLDVVASFRSVSIENTIKDVETKTNAFLTNHFDAEIRVEFDVAEADKLEVTIYKDGNTCTFEQLSKGQRCLLKFTFGVSVMQAVSNHHGITAAQIFFDEALSGLDDNMKIKSYGLLETLSKDHDSVFVIDHSEALKSMFSNKFSVELKNGVSTIESA